MVKILEDRYDVKAGTVDGLDNLLRHSRKPDGSYWSALFSPCMKYRYVLGRVWDESLPALQVIALNPSTADEASNDPTVTRCVNFAKAWGCGELIMTNIFAFRATLPKDMKACEEPIGLDNDYYLTAVSKVASIVLGAWGVDGSYRGRADQVAKLIPNLQCLGTTKAGQPRHPLYLKADLMPELWR